ncbi:conserved hypothetical protein [Verticillium alfalfae VaMs.102]|uniref:Inositol phoshorylceramide synthase regulatory subunit kei1 n=1 Tax=Verticillium alfalfae (strain VaMs.102 / ATCC MYA-4576 / FGSC 10136) TaxID=526221 RepID=C9STS4_VERA1|nr:conserved hypothetical protein [Verticillium alfalfae VaMs.102]EEY22235.1 conserved hypothetical protein [Verticillium alfalfae VaMs.102]
MSQTFLGLISLQNGTEMITLTLIFNKLTGFYGLLAILTGYSLSLLQLSMYIYSLGVLLVTAALLPHIRKQTPFECLALAWLYIIDTVLNAAYTTAFALSWFAHSTALERHPSPADGSSISVNSAVPDATLATGTPVVPDVPGSTKHIGPEESWTSLGLVIGFTVVRVYLALVVMAFAQKVLQRVGESGWVPENRKRELMEGSGGGVYDKLPPSTQLKDMSRVGLLEEHVFNWASSIIRLISRLVVR